jgi:hypothetical protein
MQSADSIEYSIYFPALVEDGDKLLQDILTFSSTLSSKYCWHSHSRFSLSPSSIASKNSTHFSGKVFYSDCINDEYFTIYILLEISKKFPDCAILHFDTHDGQILLIDAADCIPEWITPDTSENRLWIKNGRLHLIPQSIDFDSPQQAILSLCDETIVSTEMGTKAFSRVMQYALYFNSRMKIDEKKLVHQTRLALPIQIASMLAASDDATLLLHLAVQCYYTEPTPGKVKRRHINRETDSLNVNILFSRTRYAQLYHSRPPAELIDTPDRNKELEKKTELIEKLIIGFEILAHRPVVETVYSLEWDAFLEFLVKEISYFGVRVLDFANSRMKWLGRKSTRSDLMKQCQSLWKDVLIGMILCLLLFLNRLASVKRKRR